MFKTKLNTVTFSPLKTRRSLAAAVFALGGPLLAFSAGAQVGAAEAGAAAQASPAFAAPEYLTNTKQTDTVTAGFTTGDFAMADQSQHARVAQVNPLGSASPEAALAAGTTLFDASNQVAGRASAAFVQAPATYVLNSRQDIAITLNGEVPDDAVIVALAWSDTERAMQPQFGHDVDRQQMVITSDRLDTLPAGDYQLQLILTSPTAGRLDKATHRITVVEPAPAPIISTFDFGFGNAPATYDLGASGDIALAVQGELPADADLLILAWSDSERRMVGEFAFTLTGQPWVIPAERLETLPVGQVQLQIAYRENNRVKGKKERHTLQVQHRLPQVSFEAMPESFIQGQAAAIGVSLDCPLPGTCNLEASIRSAQSGNAVASFTLDPESPAIPADQLNVLATGDYLLEVVTQRDGQDLSKQAATFSVLPAPVPAAIGFTDATARERVTGDGQTIAYEVSGDVVEGHDLVIQAWSVTTQSLYENFAYRTEAVSGLIPADRLDRLVPGEYAVQVLLRLNNSVVSTQSIRVNVSEPVVEAEPVPVVPVSAAFNATAKLTAEAGKVPSVGYTVTGDIQGHDLVFQAWSAQQQRLVAGWDYSVDAASGSISAEHMSKLPEGLNVVQIIMRDGDDNKLAVISREVQVYVPISAEDPTVQNPSPDEQQDTTTDPETDPTTDPTSDTTKDTTTDTTTDPETAPTTDEPVAELDPADESPTDGNDGTSPDFPDANAGQLGTSALGFTEFPRASGSRTIYVSSSEGSDNNDGLSPNRPLKTPRAGYNLLRWNEADHLLFKAGDTFTSGLGKVTIRGKSQAEPIVFGVYGNGPRPMFRLAGESLVFGTEGTKYLAFVGLETYSYKHDPNHPEYNPWSDTSTAFYFIGDASNILIEDCKISYFAKGIVFEDVNESRIHDIAVRRNIIRYCWNKGDRGAGIYTNRVRNMRVEENLIDHNGWHPDIAAGRDGGLYQRGLQAHGCYFSGRYNSGVPKKWPAADNGSEFVIEFHGNIVARSSANGCQFRLGGNITENVFYGNPMALYTWTNDSSAHRNVILNGTHVDYSYEFYQRGWGMQIIAGGEYTHNVIANVSRQAAGSHAIVYEHSSAQLRNNVFYNWRAEGKDWAVWNKHGHSSFDDQVTGNLTDMDNFKFVDPTRNLDTYYTNGSAEDFLDAAASRPRGVWVDDFDPRSISKWIRDGFEVTLYD